METFKIKTHRKGRQYETPHFYILSKGKNAGSPSKKPYGSCFVVFGNNLQATDKLFWIGNILYRQGYFKHLIAKSNRGYIHIGLVRKLFNTALKRYGGDYWEGRFKMLQYIEDTQRNLEKQAHNIQTHKILLVRSYGL